MRPVCHDSTVSTNPHLRQLKQVVKFKLLLEIFRFCTVTVSLTYLDYLLLLDSENVLRDKFLEIARFLSGIITVASVQGVGMFPRFRVDYKTSI